MPLELQYMTRGSFKVVVETSIELEWGQILSSSNVQAGPFLSAMCGRLLSRYSLGSTLIAVSREAQSGRRLLGTNGGSLWLWCCKKAGEPPGQVQHGTKETGNTKARHPTSDDRRLWHRRLCQAAAGTVSQPSHDMAFRPSSTSEKTQAHN